MRCCFNGETVRAPSNFICSMRFPRSIAKRSCEYFKRGVRWQARKSERTSKKNSGLQLKQHRPSSDGKGPAKTCRRPPSIRAHPVRYNCGQEEAMAREPLVREHVIPSKLVL